ncbi:Major Facilitator Superfamily transporter [Pseudarthrobacter phenanthrenivorans Sphe3]|uniref:Major Facilitator Superfamily transporter n=1 Tax=Pseudarthrobacter phenanthrenivorans (strain DSM 18606 / JCM 16027 / LMG 23796 / Sphe3) TaxID=930171 RepID=F0M7Q1_PSEPM|nr:MFS transporter [Pseudarthrobacter phenanthrenivorans]ADX74830.1 Major Facilitator Superfamily transporter [Pseudarthrobacter phenanthrenivorans Sphe3]
MAPPPPSTATVSQPAIDSAGAPPPEHQTQPVAVVSERLPWKHTFISLKVPNFRIFAVGHFVAVIAIWMQRIAQDWLVLELSGSVTAVGITVALQFLPSLLLGPWGGMVADRFAKRKILILCQSLAAVLAAALAVLALTGAIEVWHVYVIALVLGLVTVLDQPARQVFVHELVGPTYLRNAISVNSTTFQLGGLIGPALAGWLLMAMGAGWAFAGNAFACCSTVAMLLILRKDQLFTSAPVPKSKGMLREGLRYALSKPTIYWPWLMAGFIAVFAMGLPVVLAAFADHVFNVGAGGYGLLNALVALGALAGAVASTRRRQLRLRSVVFCAGMYGAMLCVAAAAPSMLVFGAMMVLSGFWCLMFLTGSNQLVQVSSNMGIRGRVMSLYIMVLIGGQAIGGPMLGWIAEHADPHVALLVSGGVPAAAALAVAVILARKGSLLLRVNLRDRRQPVRIVSRAAA